MMANGSAAVHGSADSEAARTAANDLVAVLEAVHVVLKVVRASVAEAWARVLLMIEQVAFAVRLVSDGAWSRRPFRGYLLRGRSGFWRWLRRLFGCCCEGSGCRFRC